MSPHFVLDTTIPKRLYYVITRSVGPTHSCTVLSWLIHIINAEPLKLLLMMGRAMTVTPPPLLPCSACHGDFEIFQPAQYFKIRGFADQRPGVMIQCRKTGARILEESQKNGRKRSFRNVGKFLSNYTRYPTACKATAMLNLLRAAVQSFGCNM
jgi:hypothetical protein